LAVLLAIAVGSAGGQAPRDEDPLPLLRIALTPEQLVQELERFKQGALVKLPRAEFEQRVRKAAATSAPAKTAARVVRANYFAELADQGLVQGRGEWAVHNPGPASAALPLAPLSLALSHAAWEDGRPAIVGDFDGKGLAAWVEGAGLASLFFDWSCRGTQTPQGLTFNLRLPPCPQTTMELRLPVDSWPAIAPRAGLLTGPHDAGSPAKRLWKLQLAGRTQIELTIRKVPSTPVAQFVQSQARQMVTPDHVAAEYEFQVEVPHGAVRELTFDGDGTLEPYEVTARSADLTWRWDAPPDKSKPGTLTVAFHEPQQGTIAGLRVQCLAPRPTPPAVWASSGLRLKGAVCRTDTLKLQLHPDLHLGRWYGGDYQLTGTATEPDGGLTLTLVNARATLATPSVRPRCQLAANAAEYTATQETRWRIEPGTSLLDSDIAYIVARGELRQLTIKLPTVPGPYRVESVEVEPKGYLRGWAPAGPLLIVDLHHAITPRTVARLRVRLSAPLKAKGVTFTQDVPDVVPLGAAVRDGKHVIDLDPLYHAQLLQSSVPALPPRGLQKPPGDQPAYVFAYHDQALTGKLRLFAQSPRLQVRSQHHVELGQSDGQWHAQVDISPLLGHPAHVDVYLSPALDEPWHVMAEGQPALVHRVERLPAQESLPQLLRLGATSAVGQAAMGLALPRGALWRIHFARPLTQKARLRLEGSLRPRLLSLLGDRLPLLVPSPSPWHALSSIGIAAARSDDPATIWDIPLLLLPGIQQQEGEITVHTGGQRIESVRGHGIESASAVASDAGVSFRVEPAWPNLALTTRRGLGATAGSAVCESSELTTCMAADGALSHLLRVRVRDWREPRFAVVVPGPALGLAARVDGIWVDRLEVESTPQGTRLVVPMNTAAPAQQVELLYASTTAAGALLAHLIVAPPPMLPLEPLVQRHFWRLPADWVPSDGGRWRLRGEPDAVRSQQQLAVLADRLWHAGQSLLPDDSPGDTALEAQREGLRKAENRLRGKLSPGDTLGDALDGLATLLPDTMPLVVDAEGLRAAGIAPATALVAGVGGTPFWQAAGLIHVACPSGILLTTPGRVRQWQQPTGATGRLGETLDPAIVEAATHGLDHAGTFAMIDYWLRMASAVSPSDASRDVGRVFAMFAPEPAAGWLEWEPVPGLSGGPTLVLLHAPTARRLGYLIACAWLILAVWMAWRLSPASFVRSHIAASAAMILSFLWLPAASRELLAAPVLLAEVLAFGLTFTLRTWPGRAAPRLSKSTMVRTTASAIVLAVVATMPLVAQVPARPEPHPVLVIRGDRPGDDFVLVAPDLLRKLDDMAAERPVGPAGAVVVAAQYQGKLSAGVAEFEARFDLHQFADKGTFVLPLTGVQLQPGVFLDGAPVFPTAHKGGYALTVRGKGMHQLSLRFQLRPALVSDLHELRCGIPKAGQCQLEVTSTVPARGLYLVGGLGAAKVQFDKSGLATVNAQLGHEGVLQLRWPAAIKPAQASGAVEVREAYAWDLRPRSLALAAGVQFAVARGTLAQVRFALPEGLEVRQVELKARAGPAPVLPAPALRQWRVVGQGGGRQLVIDFAQPVTGTVTLLIDMVPRLALTPGQWVLRLPAPLGATSTAGILAYRVEGVEAVAGPQNLSVGTVITPELLDEPWAKLALRDAPAALKVVKFSRISPAAALVLAVQPAPPTAHVDAKWHVGPRIADLAARIKVVSTAEDLVLVELELPSRCKLVRIGEVGGEHIHHWSRQDRLVQLWLQQPRKQITLEVEGWVEHPKADAGAAFELAPVRVLHARSVPSDIVLQPQSGMALTPEKLLRVAIVGLDTGLRLHSDMDDYSARFTMHGATVAATGRAFSLLERRGDSVEMATALHLQPQPGELRVVVSQWNGSDLRLEAPASILRKGHKQQGVEHVWTLQVPPGLPQQITLTLRGRAAVTAPMQAWAMPDIKVDRVALEEHWVGLVGVELVNGKAVALRPVGTAPAYPVPLNTLATGTQIGKLAPRAAPLAVRIPMPAPSAQVLFALHDTLWTGTQWSHRLQTLAFASGQGELHVRLPDGARCREVTVDGRVVPPGVGAFAIPLVGAPGPRWVLVWWTTDNEGAGATPILAPPSIEGVAPDAIRQRFWLPSAYEPINAPARLGERGADLLLRQAEARMQLCRLWAEARPPVDELRREQQAFHALLHAANARIAQLGRHGAVGAAELGDRATQLARENAALAAQGKYSIANPRWSRAGLAPLTGLPLGENGMPVCWQTGGSISLVSARHRDEALTRSAAELTILIAVALLLITLLRRGVAMLHLCWAEAIAAAAAVGVVLGGWTPLAVSMLALAVVLRVAWLVALLRRVLPAWFATAAEATNGDNGPIPSPPAA
jgi:hypothetical protein